METIIFKAPDGTKARLKSISGNVSQLLREWTAALTEQRIQGSALDKAGDLVGCVNGPRHMATSKDYLKQYEKHR